MVFDENGRVKWILVVGYVWMDEGGSLASQSSESELSLDFIEPEVLEAIQNEAPAETIGGEILNTLVTLESEDAIAASNIPGISFDKPVSETEDSINLPSGSGQTTHLRSGARVPLQVDGLTGVPTYASIGEDKLKTILTETIKEEIRCKIQLKRISMGQEELRVDFTQPGETISYEAVKRRNEIRMKNRLYAKISRERTQDLRSSLARKNIELTKLNANLTRRIEELKKLLQTTEEGLEEHLQNCPYNENTSLP
ncbi:uncharacterized protein LOC131954864 [Physella acuta]|uniref:uncharacterized protein LOC131954864 n=1 Tax=Physella acuta TaxID=109671 RepID=UPI0027DE5EC9|nr:uncharacterized protein LOC131954864 [Physella acuta]XP_059174663.1 uncharacterized protein LOC131954864 [Physella acuta]XP_059174664.1 uncharacterized protein LOC131954864 [Physella acuta]